MPSSSKRRIVAPAIVKSAPAADVLSPRAVKRAGIFAPGRVRDLRRYRTGRDGLRLWMLLTFELWRRQVVDRENLSGT